MIESMFYCFYIKFHVIFLSVSKKIAILGVHIYLGQGNKLSI